MGIKEIGINTRNWVDSAQDREYWKALAPGSVIHGIGWLVNSHYYKHNNHFLSNRPSGRFRISRYLGHIH